MAAPGSSAHGPTKSFLGEAQQEWRKIETGQSTVNDIIELNLGIWVSWSSCDQTGLWENQYDIDMVVIVIYRHNWFALGCNFIFLQGLKCQMTFPAIPSGCYLEVPTSWTCLISGPPHLLLTRIDVFQHASQNATICDNVSWAIALRRVVGDLGRKSVPMTTNRDQNSCSWTGKGTMGDPFHPASNKTWRPDMWKGHPWRRVCSATSSLAFSSSPRAWSSTCDLFEPMKAHIQTLCFVKIPYCCILLQLNQKWWKYDGNIWKPLSVGRSPNGHLRSNPRTWASWALNTNTSSSCRLRNLGQKVMLFHLCNHWLVHRQSPSSSKFSARGRDLIIRWILIGVQTFDGWWLKWIKSR